MVENPPINLASDTTAEQDRNTAGRRLVNFTWEDTQKKLAMFAVGIANIVAAIVVLRGVFLGVSDASLTMAAFTLLSSSNFLIIGFYFGRTNHARPATDVPAATPIDPNK